MLLPWLLISGGSSQLGIRYAFCAVSIRKRSSLTGVFSGAPRERQSGSNSFSASGSITAPERMCAPISEPFSRTHTPISRPAARGELLEADSRREPRRASADDDHVVRHGFALHEPFPRAFWQWTHYNYLSPSASP